MLNFERLWQDAKHGWRALVNAPAFSAVAILSIACGTGANVAIFSAVDALLLRPPSIERPEELITIGTRVDRGLGTALRMSYSDYQDVRARARSLNALVGFTSRWVGFRSRPGTPARIKVATLVSANYFQALGVAPALGRDFRAEEDEVPGRDRVVMLSHAVWLSDFGGSRDVVGQTIRLAGIDFTVTGVVPESFSGLAKDSTYVYPGEPPFEVAYFPFRQQPRGNMVLLAHTAGESAAAVGPLSEAVRHLDGKVPVYNAQTVEHFYDARATGVGRVTVTLIGSMGLMGLTLAMVGLYGLVSYAVSRRTREIGVRVALGAGPAQVVGLIVRDGTWPAWIGMALGLVLSVVTARLLPALVPIGPRYNATTVLACLPLLIAVTIVAAGIPARRAVRIDPTVALRAD